MYPIVISKKQLDVVARIACQQSVSCAIFFPTYSVGGDGIWLDLLATLK